MEAFPESILFLENLCGAEIHHYIETCGVSSSEKASEALLERGIFSELMQQICSCCTVTGEAFNTSWDASHFLEILAGEFGLLPSAAALQRKPPVQSRTSEMYRKRSLLSPSPILIACCKPGGDGFGENQLRHACECSENTLFVISSNACQFCWWRVMNTQLCFCHSEKIHILNHDFCPPPPLFFFFHLKPISVDGPSSWVDASCFSLVADVHELNAITWQN